MHVLGSDERVMLVHELRRQYKFSAFAKLQSHRTGQTARQSQSSEQSLGNASRVPSREAAVCHPCRHCVEPLPGCKQDQALQSQRHDALQRLSDHHASVAARQHIASGRADSQMALLMQRNGRKLPPNLMKDATLLMDRARCGRPPSRAGQNTGQSSQLSLATNSASGHAGKVPPQQWAPEPCSIACTSFRQSLPPHSSEHAVHVTRKVYTPTTPQGASQSSLSRRTAYGEVLRRVRSAHGPPSQATADRKAGDALGPWPQ
ncbi:hypothetical protein ABBQ32_003766 [Trebouxia sp. C0010 RCD-2024]